MAPICIAMLLKKYRERGKHYLINSQNILSGKVIDYPTKINSHQVDSGNAMGNFHANFRTKAVGHPHSGVCGSLPNTDNPNLFLACKPKRAQKDLGISNPAQDILMLEVSDISNTQSRMPLEIARQTGGAEKILETI